MEKIWLKSYPPGVPAEIDPSRCRTLKELLERTCAEHAERVAFIQMGAQLTYRQLDDLSKAFAAWLQHEGFRKGDRIAIMLPNTLQYPIALFGALRAGLTVVNTNPLYTAPELEYQLVDSGATAILIIENFAHVLQQVITRTKVRRVLVTSVGDFLRFPKSLVVNYVVRHVRKQVPAWNIPQTIDFKQVIAAGSKTAARSRGPGAGGSRVSAVHRWHDGRGEGSDAVARQHQHERTAVGGMDWRRLQPARGTAHCDTAVPHLRSVGKLHDVRAPGMDQPADHQSARSARHAGRDETHPCNYISGVNTLFNAMLHTPGFGEIDFSGLRVTLGGGMAVQAAVAERWKRATGCTLTQAWGLTETSPAACINPE